MSRIFQRVVLVSSVTIFVSLGLGFALGEFGFFGVHAGSQDGAYEQLGVFRKVLKTIQTDYVTEPNMADVSTGALRGLVESLDADSSYLTPTEYRIYKERSQAANVQLGITLAKRFGYAVVVSVLPGSPADKEHIASGDVVESIDGQSTRELSVAVLRLMLEGKPGSTLTLSVVRAHKPDAEKVTLTRAAVSAPALGVQQLEGGSIIVLKPGDLTAARVDEVAAQLKGAAHGHKILLDLRDSTGTDERQGLRLANFFLRQGTMATLEGQKFPRQTFTADAAQCLTDAPVAVIINRTTYGAAELTAAALADNKRADAIGEHSFGMGVELRTIELKDGAALILSVAKYQTPSGKKIEDDAVTPTVAVGPSAEEDEETDSPTSKTDDMLAKAVELLKAK